MADPHLLLCKQLLVCRPTLSLGGRSDDRGLGHRGAQNLLHICIEYSKNGEMSIGHFPHV